MKSGLMFKVNNGMRFDVLVAYLEAGAMALQRHVKGRNIDLDPRDIKISLQENGLRLEFDDEDTIFTFLDDIGKITALDIEEYPEYTSAADMYTDTGSSDDKSSCCGHTGCCCEEKE